MGLLLIIFAFSFIIMFLVNITWLSLNLYSWAVHNIQYLLQGMNFAENIYTSTLPKRAFQKMYLDYTKILQIKNKIDPKNRFTSDVTKRLLAE